MYVTNLLINIQTYLINKDTRKERNGYINESNKKRRNNFKVYQYN